MSDLVPSGGFFFKLIERIVPGCSTVADYFDDLEKRRTDRRIERLEAFARWVTLKLDTEAADRVPPDLFEQVMENAICDEDQGKVPYYGALVALIARRQLDPYLVRLLGRTLRELTVHELEELPHGGRHGASQFLRVPETLRDAFYLRVTSLGLYDPRWGNPLTSLGMMVVELGNDAREGQ